MFAPGEDPAMRPGIEKGHSTDRSAFRKFLNWLDLGIDSNGEKYLEIRRRLVQYFDRKSCASPDELADETLNRIARRLAEEGEIRGVTPIHYCYLVARFVFLEYQRRPDRSYVSTEVLLSLPASSPGAPGPSELDAAEIREQRMKCLESCLQTLQAGQRELIVEYYRGERGAKIEHRSALAARLGVTANALSIRACRIRAMLERCVRTCCHEK
jgi:DNA-directed RNA polymerase specialized sigma24 family protein